MATPSSRARTRTKLLRLGLLAGAVTLVAAGLSGCEPNRKAVTAQGFKYRFDNWDYDENAGNRPDHPVSIIFVSNAPNVVTRTYQQMAGEVCGWLGCGNGGQMRLNGVGPSRPGVSETDPWRSFSNGQKTSVGCAICPDANSNIHLRLYGPNGRDGTQVYQGSYGNWQYYAIGTVHLDKNEGKSNEDFGYSNIARSHLLYAMAGAGKWVYEGRTWVDNRCTTTSIPLEIDASHHCDHDGYAWIISIA